MNYQESINWLFQLVPSYQNIGKNAYKENLDNITHFCEYLGNPQNQFKSIHIAGTNGKGSTAHMIASILQEAGYKIGLHTSPHLKDFRERNRINGEPMPEKFVKDFIRENQEFIKNQKASFFEVTVAMGFQYFAENQVDLAVIETGLGGRLDATNIIKPEISVITNIGLDHTTILGETIQDIALEKAGIIKDKTPVIIGEVTSETQEAFEHKANLHQAPLYFAEEMQLPNYKTDLKGLYQKLNTRTATAAIHVLKEHGWNISEENIQEGLQKVSHNTGLRGRWDILQEHPLTIADTAHNAEGIKYIIQQIKETPHQQLHLVLGFVNDKDVCKILALFPQNARYYFCEPNIPRKMPVEEIKNIATNKTHAQYYKSVEEALSAAKSSAQSNDMIYIGGSTFVVSEII